MLLISVIIPVYNSELFVEKAIKSVLNQPENIEIIVVDDGSSDKSLFVCRDIANCNKNVRIFQHPDKKNHGRSASRNLGIKSAKGNYIAFLDADDYYLPNRFTNDIEELVGDDSLDGVYNAISAHYYREYTKAEKNKLQLTTLRKRITPEKLFESMGPIGHFGYFSGIGLTVRRKIFDKVGFFNKSLVVAEDTELWLRMALGANLGPGIIHKPVAMRGVHNTNSSFKENDLYRISNLVMYELVLHWSLDRKIAAKRIDLLWNKIWINRALNAKDFNSDLVFWVKSVVNYPRLLLLKRVYKTFPVFKKIKNLLIKI